MKIWVKNNNTSIEFFILYRKDVLLLTQELKIGSKVGHWTIIADAPSLISPGGTKRKAFLCKCACGTEKIVARTSLKNHKTTNCGCRGVFFDSKSKIW